MGEPFHDPLEVRPSFVAWLLALLIAGAAMVWMSIPNLLSTRSTPGWRASAALSTLVNIRSAQAQFQATGCVDGDGDGIGEFGFFAELSGGIGLRTKSGFAGTQRVSPPVLSGAFANVHTMDGIDGGVVTRSGYMFQMYLPDRNAHGAPESGGVGSVSPDSDRSERSWCCYAWPAERHHSTRVFFVNQDGDVMAATNDKRDYLGNARVPHYAAAFKRGTRMSLTGPIADQCEGHDGQVWTRVL